MRSQFLALAVLCPALASAQDADFERQWMVELSAGTALRPKDLTKTFGGAYAITVGSTVSPRVSWRAGLEYQTWPSNVWHNPNNVRVLGATLGLLATRTAPDRGFYATSRVGMYLLDAYGNGAQPGGYAGVGAAVPLWRGALTLEAGLQGYVYVQWSPGPDDASAPSTPNFGASTPGHVTWAVPIRIGFRWLS